MAYSFFGNYYDQSIERVSPDSVTVRAGSNENRTIAGRNRFSLQRLSFCGDGGLFSSSEGQQHRRLWQHSAMCPGCFRSIRLLPAMVVVDKKRGGKISPSFEVTLIC